MDINSLLFVGLAILVILLIIGIIHKIMSMIISVVTIVVIVMFLWNVTPVEYKACVDLSLALSGSKLFEKISPEHQEIIDKTDIKVNLNSNFTLAYPKFAKTSSRKEPITNENNHDFDINLFSYDKDLREIRVVSTPRNADTVTKVLKNMGISIVK